MFGQPVSSHAGSCPVPCGVSNTQYLVPRAPSYRPCYRVEYGLFQKAKNRLGFRLSAWQRGDFSLESRSLNGFGSSIAYVMLPGLTI